MRVIICGAGQVGYNIAAYLAREDNNITIIDMNPRLIEQINDDLDVNGIVGHASNPDILDQAGATDADLIIAVTHHDEVNMVACQIAHSLFNVPKKIARIRQQDYLRPAWSNLFSRAHMPIDVIISPEIEVANAIHQRLTIPGTTNIVSLAEGRVHLAGVYCEDDCPIINTQLQQIETLFPDLPIVVCLILRDDEIIVPGANDQIMPGDEVYFFTDTEHLRRAMAAFGHEEQEARNIVIIGGGNIGLNLATKLRQENRRVQLKIIESDSDRAAELSELLPGVIVLLGSGLSQDILEEANISETETLVTVTNDDETNILGSLLAKQFGCERLITLVNNPEYMPLVSSLDIDATVSPRSSTVSTIMQHVRRGRIKALRTIHDGLAEIIEAEVSDTSELVNVSFSELNLPKDVMIGMIVRDDKILLPRPDLVIRTGDHLIIMARAGQARKVEQMFSVPVNLF